MMSMNLTVQHCQTEDSIHQLNARKIALICIFSFIGLISVIATAIDNIYKAKNIKSQNGLVKVLICFSVTSNFPKLFSTDISDKSISCLPGIRVLTIFYIILGHHFIAKNLIFLASNFIPNMALIFHRFFSQIFLNGFLSVEIFFLIGGFVNSYIRTKHQLYSTTVSTKLMMILHRLWRIYPAYIFSILLSMLLTARGPVSLIYEKEYVEKCATEWWKNILFVNNFIDQRNVCLHHTWYLACDMQLFLTSLFTIPILIRNPKKGIFINVAVIIFGLSFTAAWVWIKNTPPTFLFTKVNEHDMAGVHMLYILPFPHIAPYFIGILLGYVLADKGSIKITKINQVVGWIVASVMFTFMLFITKRWNSGIAYTPVESVLYFTFSKPLYASAVAWMIFCCVTGHGGIINYILSLKIWLPLSRISFTVYLVSFPLQLFYNANLRTTADSHRMVQIWEYFGDLSVSCLLSLAMVTLIESPLHAMKQLIVPKNEMKIEDYGNSRHTA